MPWNRLLSRLVVTLLLLVSLACGESDNTAPAVEPEEASPTGTLAIVTANHPLEWMARRLAPDAQIAMPVPEGVDPATWQPPAEVIATVHQPADLIVLNGAGHDAWTTRSTLPRSALVDTSAGFSDQYIVRENALTHSHGPEGEHSHEETAFTTWIDPRLASLQARALADAIGERSPATAEQTEANLTALLDDLSSLDARLEAAFEALGETPLVTSHSTYAYLARRYDLDIRSVHWEPDQTPDRKAWHDLEHEIGDRPVRWMVWEAEPLEETRTALEQRGIGVIVFDPAANPSAGDYLSIQLANAERLEAAARAMTD